MAAKKKAPGKKRAPAKAPSKKKAPAKAPKKTPAKKKAAKKTAKTAAKKPVMPPITRRKGQTLYWLMKSEPDVYSIHDLEKAGSDEWEGVRNYQARNFMRVMAEGDLVLFYHSNAKPSGVAGVAKIVGGARPDPTQFDPDAKYFDPKSKREEPRWDLVDVGFVEAFDEVLSLAELKADAKLEGMHVTRKGMRISVTPVDKAHFRRVLKLADAKTKVS